MGLYICSRLVLFGIVYNLTKYCMMKNLYLALLKTLLKVLTDVLISLYALSGFFVYIVFAFIGLFTVKGFACGVQGNSFGIEIFKMLLTFVFYLFMIVVDVVSIVLYSPMLMVKDLESPLYLVLEWFGLVPSDEQLAQNTRFKIDIKGKGCECVKYLVIVIEKILMYASGYYMFGCLL